VGVDVVDKLKIEMVEVGKIFEYKNNAKLHPDYQVEQILKIKGINPEKLDEIIKTKPQVLFRI